MKCRAAWNNTEMGSVGEGSGTTIYWNQLLAISSAAVLVTLLSYQPQATISQISSRFAKQPQNLKSWLWWILLKSNIVIYVVAGIASAFFLGSVMQRPWMFQICILWGWPTLRFWGPAPRFICFSIDLMLGPGHLNQRESGGALSSWHNMMLYTAWAGLR